MTEATRLRAQLQGDRALVRLRMSHEMESGQRKDSAGKTIPAWYIQEASVLLNGQVVLRGQLGTAVSKNPYLQFQLKGVKAGDTLSVTWQDNRGQQRRDDTVVTP